MDDLAALFPQPKLVQTRQGEIHVYPLKGRLLAPFAGAVAPLMDWYNRYGIVASLDGWRALVQAQSTNLIKAVAVAVEKPADDIGELYPDDLIALAAAVLEVNTDFFGQHLAPKLGEAMREMTATLAGLMRSTGSPAPDTETSETTP